jgi:hypothetical protein
VIAACCLLSNASANLAGPISETPRSIDVVSTAFEALSSASSAETPSGLSSYCDQFFGPFVVALACDEETAMNDNSDEGTPGTFIFIDVPAGIKADSWPGVAQAVGSPLKVGSMLVIAGTAWQATQLALQVKNADGTVSVLFFTEIGMQDGGQAFVSVKDDGAYGEKDGVSDVQIAAPGGTFLPSRVRTIPKPPKFLKTRRSARKLSVRFLAEAPRTIIQLASTKKLLYSRAMSTMAGRRTSVSLKLPRKASTLYVALASVNPGNTRSSVVYRRVPKR